MLEKYVKSVGYLILWTGAGFCLMQMVPSDDEKRKSILGDRKDTAYYKKVTENRTADQFTNALIATATSGKTIYGAKQAKAERISDKAAGKWDE